MVQKLLLRLLLRHDEDWERGCLMVMGLDSRGVGHGLMLLVVHLMEHNLHVLVVLLLEDLLSFKLHLLLDRELLLLLLLLMLSDGLLGGSGVCAVGRGRLEHEEGALGLLGGWGRGMIGRAGLA